jgi:cytochrome oxidase assembly protein ShyY1
LDSSDRSIIVSRGFIPFADRTPESWTKYNFEPRDSFDAVLKKSISPHSLGPSNPETGPGREYERMFFFEEIPKMAAQLPYPVFSEIYVQRIGAPSSGEFPAQAISIEIPPSTHFGYTIEWALLALATLSAGFLVQAFPRKRRRAAGMNGAALYH